MTGQMWERVEGLAIVTHDDSTLIVNLPRLSEQQRPLVLEGPAHVVWGLVDGTRTQQEIVAAASAMYGIGPDAIEPDIAAFLADAERQGLARRRSAHQRRNTSSMKRSA